VLQGDCFLGNVLVHDGHVSALIDFEFSRMGPPDLELISVVRALDAERPPRSSGPPLLAWPAEDYPELLAVPDLVSRRWQYALTYTIRQTIFWPLIFWPPDRAEADGLEVTHPLRTLRRLINAPLGGPLPARQLGAERPLRRSGIRRERSSAQNAQFGTKLRHRVDGRDSDHNGGSRSR
jgi:Phosphotransferase enzyme family